MPDSPVQRLHRSHYHEAFLEHNQQTRDFEGARRLLAMEWRYLGPLLSRIPSPRVLDLACGSGTQSVAWAERSGRVVGIDFDPELLRLGRERAAGILADTPHSVPTWACGDATGLPFADGSFDIVFCNSLLEHVPQWNDVLAETSRVLSEGGVVVVYTTNRHCPLQQEVNYFPLYSWLPSGVKRRVMNWIMEHRRDMVNYTDFPAVNWFTFPQMRRAFEAHDLRPLDRLDLGANGSLEGRLATFARAATRVPILKWAYYFYAISMAMYGVRRPSVHAARRS